MTAPPLLDVRGLTKVFGGFAAVAEVDLAVQPGSIHAVIGPNGAGKTTLFRVVTGTHRPTAGTVRFGGRDLTGAAPHIVCRRGLTQSFQITNVFARLTVLESVRVALLARDRRTWSLGTWKAGTGHRLAEEAAELIGEVGLAAVADAQAQALSHGDQRILEVALPDGQPGDQPATARGLAVVLCEHDMDIVFGISDEVTVLHRGRVISHGTPAAVQTDPLVAEVYLGGET